MFLLLSLFLVGGNVYYVTVDGSDAVGDGSAGAPWATITHALDSVPDGALIEVGPGTYTGRVRLRGSFASGVTVRAVPAYAARLRHSATTVTCFEGIGITLEGFDIAHDGPGADPLVVQIQDLRGSPGGADAVSRIVLRNNIIHDSTNNDLLKINNGARDIHIIGNLFYNQTGSDEHIDLNGALNCTISDNIFFNDFEGSGRTNTQDTSSFVVVKNSAGIGEHGSHTINRNIFLHYQGGGGTNFLLLGEDGHAFYETQDILVENNLFLGDGTDVMRAAFGVKGCRNVVFRHNTVVGDLPAAAFAMRLNREGDNPVNDQIAFYNNIWCDPTGTMGSSGTGNANDFSDTPPADSTGVVLSHNVYYNGGQLIPSDPAELVNPEDDPAGAVFDPEIPVPGVILPHYNGTAFPSGSATIAEEFVRLVAAHGTPANALLDGLGLDDMAAADDILGHTRGVESDPGAVEAFGCFADLNGDGSTDIDDLADGVAAWPGGGYDLDGDGRLTVRDLVRVTFCL